MKIKFNKSILFLLFFKIFLTSNANAFQDDITKKYNKIFSSPILSSEDVNNYQKAYYFQEKCKWKSANSYILKI